MRYLKRKLLFAAAFMLFFVVNASAQQVATITGVITDAETGQPLPAASVSFEPASIGEWVVSDADGRYSVNVPKKAKSIVFSYIGYQTQTVPLLMGKTKAQMNIKLVPESNVLTEAVVRTKRVRYTNKNNPAVDLIRKAIASKDSNRIESRESYEYTKYEKMEFSMGGLNDSIRKSLVFRNFPFFNKYLDTTSAGDYRLPIFFRENISQFYYQKSPEAKKEYIVASKIADFNDFVEADAMNTFIDGIVNRSNIYSNTISLFNKEFQSPMSPLGPTFYRYHIVDTVDVSGTQCISLNIYPRNDADYGFAGNLYITNDSLYALKKAELRFARNINVNFVNNFSLVQEYTLVDSTWCLTTDNMVVDFGPLEGKNAVVGSCTSIYYGYQFDKKIPDSKLAGAEVERLPECDSRPEQYWAENRPIPLSSSEQGVYDMVEDMKTDSKFNLFLKTAGIILSGVIDLNKFEFGPVESLYSFNDVEGSRFRIGGKTNARLSPSWFFDGYLAYGTKDKKYKYRLGSTYSFSKRKLHQWEFPMNMLSVSYEYDMQIPGQDFFFGSADELFLSFQRGKAQRRVYRSRFDLRYDKEYQSGLSIHPFITWTKIAPAGELVFENASGSVESIVSSQVGVKVRYAPKERFYQIQKNRFPLNHTNPTYTVSYTYGAKGLLGSDYDFHRLEVQYDKRTWFASLGYSDLWVKAGKVWGTVPFPLLVIHQANQNYVYQDEAYNMMNYMEFMSDRYASVTFSHCFSGFFLNRIPLIRNLKWREDITFKALWGDISNRNLPENNPWLLKLPADDEGNPTSFSLDGKPYMELGVGVENIFKVLKVVLVKRISHLDNPDVSEWGVRVRFRFVF